MNKFTAVFSALVMMLLAFVMLVVIDASDGISGMGLLNCSSRIPCDLTNIGALVIGVWATGLIALRIYARQKEHAEMLAGFKKSVTEQVYSRNIEYYTFDVRFDEFEKDHPDTAKQTVMDNSQKLMDKLISQSRTIIDTDVDGRGPAKKITYDMGEFTVTIPEISRSLFPGGYAQSANIHFIVYDFNLLDMIIKENNLRYWVLVWHVTDKYPVKSIMDKLAADLGKTPSSSASGFESGKDPTYSATYTIVTINGATVRTDISATELNIVHEGVMNQGFRTAHKLLSPEKILSLLFGEVAYKEKNELIKNTL